MRFFNKIEVKDTLINSKTKDTNTAEKPSALEKHCVDTSLSEDKPSFK